MAGNSEREGRQRAARSSNVAVVIPARDAAGLLPVCLGSIRSQMTDGDEVIVIDDASRDATAAVAEHYGARVLVNTTPTGPYRARNHGWRSTDADPILFTDSRCRARPGWIEAMRAASAVDGVALVGGSIHTLYRPTLAGRVQYWRQGLYSHHYTAAPGFLPWFPSGNLAVRRYALEHVDGFRAVRSGGDAEICWRIQLAGLGRLAVIDEPLMDWLPRSGLRAFLRQWPRYAEGHAALYREYCAYGMPCPPVTLLDRLHGVARVAASDLLRHRQRPDVALVDALATWVHQRALARALQGGRRRPPRWMSQEDASGAVSV